MSIAVAFILAAAQSSSASAAVQKTTDQVRAAMQRYVNAEGSGKTKARDDARAAVAQLLDFEALAKSTLGKKWAELKPAEQKRYVEALRGAMEANYLVKMGKANSDAVARARSEVLGEESKTGKTVVKTKVKAGEDTASIDYVMEKARGGGWRAVDIVTEGVSLAETYREQVARLLPKKGIEGVIAALEKKRKALETELEAS